MGSVIGCPLLRAERRSFACRPFDDELPGRFRNERHNQGVLQLQKQLMQEQDADVDLLAGKARCSEEEDREDSGTSAMRVCFASDHRGWC